jgi:hypothetical protein
MMHNFSILHSGYVRSPMSWRVNQISLGNRQCFYCHKCFEPSELSVDHIFPKIHYPHLHNDETNFVLSCRYCNSAKSAIPVDYFLMYCKETNSQFRAAKTPSVKTVFRRIAHLIKGGESVAEGMKTIRQKNREQATMDKLFCDCDLSVNKIMIEKKCNLDCAIQLYEKAHNADLTWYKSKKFSRSMP